MDYPKQHKQIVEELLNGKFILSKESHFEELKIEKDFYSKFFQVSFGYELKFTQEHAYVISEDTNETLSRDISIFFAIFCYELDKRGKNFLDELQYSEFTKAEVEDIFSNSSYIDLIESNKQLADKEKRENLINSMIRRNIIGKINDDKFYFTSAYKVFLEFAEELATIKTSNIETE